MWHVGILLDDFSIIARHRCVCRQILVSFKHSITHVADCRTIAKHHSICKEIVVSYEYSITRVWTVKPLPDTMVYVGRLQYHFDRSGLLQLCEDLYQQHLHENAVKPDVNAF